MKKLLVLGLMVMSLVGLAGCQESTNNEVSDVLDTLTVPTQVSSNFTLETLKDDVSITWSSNNEAIKIEGNNANVTQQEQNTAVRLTATGTLGDLEANKTFNVTVTKISATPDGDNGTDGDTTPEGEQTPSVVTTIAEALVAADDANAELKELTVLKSFDKGTHFTDGTDVIYAFGTKNLTPGDVYDVEAIVTTYGGAKQIKSAEVTKLEGVTPATIEAEATTLAQVNAINSALDYKFYKTTATVSVSGTTVSFVDGDQTVEVSSYGVSETAAFLQTIDGFEIEFEFFLTGGYKDWKTIITYVTADDVEITAQNKVDLVAKNINLPTSTMANLDLSTTGDFDTTIAWVSNNESVISNTGVINRQSVDTTVTLTATVTFGDATATATFDVIVISAEQTVSNDLFISEYYEGASNDKYIEIYNPTNAPVSLSNYKLHSYANAATSGSNVNLSSLGDVPANGCVVIYNNQSSTTIKELLADMIENKTALSSGSISHNGDDRYALLKDDIIIDVFGVLDVRANIIFSDGGSSVDHRAIRKAGFGATTEWNVDEWTTTSIADENVLDNLGTHTFELDTINLVVAVLTKENQLSL